jgi:hypothetical protein
MIVVSGDFISVKGDHKGNTQGSCQRDHFASIWAEMCVNQGGAFFGKFPLLTQTGAQVSETSALDLARDSVPAEKVHLRFGKTKSRRAAQTYIEGTKSA